MNAGQFTNKIFNNTTPLTIALFVYKHYWVIAAIVIVLAGGMMAFPQAYFSNLNVLLGAFLLPFAIKVQGTQRTNYPLLTALLFFGIAAALYPVKIFYFFTIAFFILFLVERHIGRINAIVFFLLASMSPFFEQVAGVLGFPIRLYLSSLAGNILNAAGLNVTVEGNMMILNGNTFTVDDACMGLNMLSTSLLAGVLMILHHYGKQRKQLRFLPLLVFFLAIFLFNVICNLTRILVLVMFNIGPEHFLHETIGLICFVTYAVIPVYCLARWITHRFGGSSELVKRSYQTTPGWMKTGIIIMATAVLWIGVNFTARKAASMKNIATAFSDRAGFRTEYMDDGVTKVSNAEALIYLKPIAEFFSGEHTPLFCWKGSGYQFRHIRKKHVNGYEIYCGEMVKPEGSLWTAWWYSNGSIRTIDQFDWRLRMLKGKAPFHLVNVTASDEATMVRYASKFLDADDK